MTFLLQWSRQGLISAEAAEKLSAFVDLILEWNPRINLTGFKTRERIEEFLIGEGVQALPHLGLSGLQVLDFGSGAGVPGLVWSMCIPDVSVTSVEIRQKKAAFQKEVVRTLRLNAEVIAGRFPEAVSGRLFDVIVTRAIRFSASLWNDAEALLLPGGKFVRFVAHGLQESGWTQIPISGRSALLIRTR
jgi:16S rRNA (guanine527-N7)-methyltransferase